MKHLKLTHSILLLTLSFLTEHAWGQSQMLAGWNFTNGSYNADLGIAANLGTGFGFNGDTSPGTVIECWDSESASVNDWDAGEFWYTEDFSTTGYHSISLGFNQKSTLWGPGKQFIIEYSLNSGASWSTAVDAYDCPQVHFCVNALRETGLALPASLENQPTVRLRWRYTGSSDTQNQGDRNIIDDIAVRGWPDLANGEFHVIQWDTIRNPANARIDQIVLTFEKEVNATTINANNLPVTGNQSGVISGNYVVTGNVVSFTPSSPIPYGERVHVTGKFSILATSSENLHAFGCSFQTPGNTNEWAVEAGPEHYIGSDSHYWYAGMLFMTPGDFDGDGDTDVLMGANNLGSIGDPDFGPVKMWWNGGYNVLGDGSTGTLATIATQVQCKTRNADSGDLDGDGDLDFYMSGCQTYIYLNNGNGTFTKVTDHMFNAWGSGMGELIDFDRDGDLDVVHAGGYYGWHENPGNGMFTAANYREITPVGDLGSGVSFTGQVDDLDGDGDLDLFWATRQGNTGALPFSAAILLNDGAMNFTVSPMEPNVIDTLVYGNQTDWSYIQGMCIFDDMDGDGWKEIIVPSQARFNGRIYSNGGTGEWTFTEIPDSKPTLRDNGSVLEVGLGPDLTRVFDFDGNGLNDYYSPNGKSMFQQYPDEYIFVKLNTNTPVNANTGTFNWVYGAAPIGDFNNDGKLDVIARIDNNDNVAEVYWQELVPKAPEKAMNSYTFGGCAGMPADSLNLDTLFTSYAGNLTFTATQSSFNGQTLSVVSDHYLKMDPSATGAGTSSGSVKATDEAGNFASISITMVENNPILEVDTIIKATDLQSSDGSIELKFADNSSQTTPYSFVWSDTLTLSPKYNASQGNLLNAPAGEYTLVFTEKYGCTDTLVTLLETLNTPPSIVTQPDSITAPDGGPATPGSNTWLTISLPPHVTDIDGDVLSYTKTSTDPSAWSASVEISNGDTLLKVDFTPTGIGHDTVRVAVSDGIAEEVATILIPVFEVEALAADGNPIGEPAIAPICADGVCRFQFTGGAGERTIQFCDVYGNDDFTITFTGDLDTTLPQGRYYICGVWDETGSYIEYETPISVLIPCTNCH